MNSVRPGYFHTMGIRLVAGRDVQPSDDTPNARAVIGNENLARVLFGARNPVGRRIFPPADSPVRTVREVVGVAANSKYFAVGEENAQAMYCLLPPLTNAPRRGVSFLLRAGVDPASLLSPVNRALLDLDPTAAVEVRRMKDALASELLPSQVEALLLGSLGALGLFLAAVGLYGVVASSVSSRTHEIGLRLALGAQQGALLRLILGETARFVAAGLALGSGVALWVDAPAGTVRSSRIEPDGARQLPGRHDGSVRCATNEPIVAAPPRRMR
jgi:hypothetical protein